MPAPKAMRAEDPKRRAAEVWGTTPAGSQHAGTARPGTREFFETVLHARSTEEQPWLNEIVPFGSLAGRSVLEVGCGAGYDAFEFCRHGAAYVGIDLAFLNTVRTREHLRPFDLFPALTQADAESLPFRTATFDAAFSNGVLHHLPDIDAGLSEIARVLKDGGTIWVIVYHRDSLFYWLKLLLVDHLLRLGFLRRSMAERLAMIEYSTSPQRPLVMVYTRRGLARKLQHAGLVVDRMWVRKLTRQDLPALPLLGAVWKRLPARWLDAAGRLFGWYLIAQAHKPAL